MIITSRCREWGFQTEAAWVLGLGSAEAFEVLEQLRTT